MDKDRLIQKSKQYVQAALSGDFAAIVSDMNAEAAAQISVCVLEQSWNSTTKELPECKGIYSADYVEVQGTDVVTVMLDYGTSALRVAFGYDHDGKISRLYATYAPLPSAQADSVQSDKFDEEPIKVGDPQHPLDGKLTMPKSSVDVPAIILVHGSGSHDMNETIGSAGNAPFADLAYDLAECGIASIRYNKRYFQYPQTATPTLTVWDEVINDVNAAISLARETAGIDKNNIFLLGHSLGGVLGPQIMKENPGLAGFVSLAGSPRLLEDIILDQNKAAIAAMNTTEPEKQALLEMVLGLVGQVKALTPESPHQTIFNINSEYWLSLKQTNPQNIVNTLAIPMLILQGGADFQVSAETDFALWQMLLKGNQRAQFKLYPGLNHLFMKTSGKADLSEYNAKAQVDEQVIKDIAVWIHSISGK